MQPAHATGPLLRFYTGAAPDDQGRTLAEILAWPDARLEQVHDYIQWLFPLPEPSGVNPAAPLMTPAVQGAFQSSPELQANMRAAWERMVRFYGWAHAGDALQPAPFFPARAANWLTAGNHNHLRLTRILRSTHLAGLRAESQATFSALEKLYVAEEARPGPPRISAATFGFWQRARNLPA